MAVSPFPLDLLSVPSHSGSVLSSNSPRLAGARRSPLRPERRHHDAVWRPLPFSHSPATPPLASCSPTELRSIRSRCCCYRTGFGDCLSLPQATSRPTRPKGRPRPRLMGRSPSRDIADCVGAACMVSNMAAEQGSAAGVCGCATPTPARCWKEVLTVKPLLPLSSYLAACASLVSDPHYGFRDYHLHLLFLSLAPSLPSS